MKSVLLVDCPAKLADELAARIEPAGWICARVSSVAEAEDVLHEVRPAMVLVGSFDSATRAGAVYRLRADPLVAGVPVLGMADGHPSPDATWIGAGTDAVRAGPAREVFAALEALLAAAPARATPPSSRRAASVTTAAATPTATSSGDSRQLP